MTIVDLNDNAIKRISKKFEQKKKDLEEIVNILRSGADNLYPRWILQKEKFNISIFSDVWLFIIFEFLLFR